MYLIKNARKSEEVGVEDKKEVFMKRKKFKWSLQMKRK